MGQPPGSPLTQEVLSSVSGAASRHPPHAPVCLSGNGRWGRITGPKMTRSAFIATSSALSCPICLHAFDAPVVTKCGHQFCEGCIRSAIQFKKECPQCRQPISSHRDLRADAELTMLSESSLARVMPSQEQLPARETWDCRQCTLANPRAAARCVACGARRPSLKEQVQAPQADDEPLTQPVGLLSSVDPESLEGQRVRVWWEGDLEWYSGRVVRGKGGKITVHYDDGERRTHRLEEVPVRLEPEDEPSRMVTERGSTTGSSVASSSVASSSAAAATTTTTTSSEPQNEPLTQPVGLLSSVDPESLEGQRVRVWWEGDLEWYSGRVVRGKGGKITVHYDDGERRTHRLEEVPVRLEPEDEPSRMVTERGSTTGSSVASSSAAAAATTTTTSSEPQRSHAATLRESLLADSNIPAAVSAAVSAAFASAASTSTVATADGGITPPTVTTPPCNAAPPAAARQSTKGAAQSSVNVPARYRLLGSESPEPIPPPHSKTRQASPEPIPPPHSTTRQAKKPKYETTVRSVIRHPDADMTAEAAIATAKAEGLPLIRSAGSNLGSSGSGYRGGGSDLGSSASGYRGVYFRGSVSYYK